jgi:hypothetical protein
MRKTKKLKIQALVDATRTINVITLGDAECMIANWQRSEAYTDTGGFKAFYIPHDEITDFFTIYANKGIGVRAYIGLEDPQGSQPLVSNLKLIFVATEKDRDGVDRDIIVSSNGEKFVFDLSKPCPHACDDQSPLYNPVCTLNKSEQY